MLLISIAMQIDEIRRNNHEPVLIIMYRPMITQIYIHRTASYEEITTRPGSVVEPIKLMGLNVVLVDYEIDGLVKVY